ncbi:amino acid ABC transporter substrate-binding protein [Mesorhizobium plurifarium]|uniref:amino acid ABC transporter substrate-binding protein n=1 Tax=Sinorhizobium arboris TaxID=76745 RepID=UPI0004081253|nr:amino acid ABC transporter substrate-binding protein [Sinorhizobium arboris]PST18558.1 amino acid ABC transporter substrate-binding protein [Mesorhizobium plurifarium]PST20209.1 amino acid ABC transporter substrate-binding protein [Mesorhizobium plurifarium]
MKTAILGLFTAALLGGTVTQAATLDGVKERGELRCGVSQGVLGFSAPDEKGEWSGFDIDFCRAVAAATLGSADKVKYVPLSTKERFTALQSGEVDLLSRQTTWTLSRDADLGMSFVGVTYYDGQAFMVRSDIGVNSVKELSGASVCTETGTTTEQNMADYFSANKIEYQVIAFEKADQTIQAFNSGRCDVYSTDASALYSQRLTLNDPDRFIVLPEVISKEPLGPAVRQGDDQWFKVVRWTLFAMIEAEELGITRENAASLLETGNTAQKRFLGIDNEAGKALGLDPKWAYRTVAAVGNYGEVFERHLGRESALKIDRGLNKLWNDGGLIYAPPVR